MFDKINVAQLYCYLAEVEWEDLVDYAQDFMGSHIEEVVYNDHSLVLTNENAIFRAERFLLSPEHMPWNLEASLTLRRREMPFDGWINVQFAKDLAEGLDGVTYCEIPEEVTSDRTGRFMLRFDADDWDVYSTLVELSDLDVDWVEIHGAFEIDLRNLELYQTRFPYR